MGLDMYLSAKKYTSGFFSPDILEKIVEVVGAKSFLNKEHSSAEVSVNVAYWRKANAIHNWFVENIQDGEDNCRSYPVSREELQVLLNLCKEVYRDKNNAHELLPSVEGFFFGGTEYDEWYFRSVEETISQLSNILEKTDHDWYFEYQSSW